MASTTLKELANLYAKKQVTIVDNITEESPILDIIPFEEASHGMWNVYEEINSVTGAGWVEMNAALGTMDVVSDLKKLDLNILGGEMEVPEDKAQMFGGYSKYFAKRLPVIMKTSGQTSELKILYDNFRAYAIANSNHTLIGGAGNANYSIVAVRFVPGVTTGIYSPEGFKNGVMLDMKPINGGNLYKNSSGVLVYGLRLKGYFGIQLADPKTVGALCNITAANVPTTTQMNNLIASVRGTPKNTYLFMHEHVKTMLFAHKGTSLNVDPGTKDMNYTFTHWNGIPVISSYNFLEGTETNVA